MQYTAQHLSNISPHGACIFLPQLSVFVYSTWQRSLPQPMSLLYTSPCLRVTAWEFEVSNTGEHVECIGYATRLTVNHETTQSHSPADIRPSMRHHNCHIHRRSQCAPGPKGRRFPFVPWATAMTDPVSSRVSWPPHRVRPDACATIRLFGATAATLRTQPLPPVVTPADRHFTHESQPHASAPPPSSHIHSTSRRWGHPPGAHTILPLSVPAPHQEALALVAAKFPLLPASRPQSGVAAPV
ncbi:hypothetical protein EDC01DRAFT_635824 [Geopyxis carbonaria]|nr:hypothetical protein EDC01DRAFT_635824 [Geopyxis carbonaria]